MKSERTIGTTLEFIRKEELKIGRDLPKTFVGWLLENNGLDVGGIHIFPVRDERDVRKTWESLSYNLENGWAEWLETFDEEDVETEHLLPFAEFGTGDYYCFDYSNVVVTGEPSIVHWSHETGETAHRAINFAEFVEKENAGEYEND